MPSWLSFSFQDASSPTMGELIIFHDHVMVVMSGIIVLISYIMYYLLMDKKYYKNLSEGTLIEMVWSIVPALLLLILVLPSMKVLYLMEDIKTPSYTFKVIAHQWYWSYVVPFYKNFSYLVNGTYLHNYEFDSMLEESTENPRLLGCSSALYAPVNKTSRILVSSTDVIHSFAIPSLGLKVDAMPGRINQLFMNPSRLGIFYGQCSEICGSNHSFMPIMMKILPEEAFNQMSKEFLLEKMEETNLKIHL